MLLKLHCITRFKISMLCYIMGFILIFKGIKWVGFENVVLGTLILGIGASCSFQSIVGHLKFYPSYYYSSFLCGFSLGGSLVTGLYLFLEFLHFSFENVIIVLIPLFISFFFLFKLMVGERFKILQHIFSQEDLKNDFIQTIQSSSDIPKEVITQDSLELYLNNSKSLNLPIRLDNLKGTF